MKLQKRIFYILMFLPLPITLIALRFLPDLIPAHYGYDNQVTRWGSKYESLIFPAINIIFGFFMLVMARLARKQEKNGENNEKVCIITGNVTLAMFNVMAYYFLYTSFLQVENLSEVTLDVNQVMFASLGISMVICGNIMPKLRMNSIIGLRTPWSMKNEVVWKKCQRFGGISFMIAGAVVLAVSLVTEGMICAFTSLAVFMVILVVDIYYSYKAAKEEEA